MIGAAPSAQVLHLPGHADHPAPPHDHRIRRCRLHARRRSRALAGGSRQPRPSAQAPRRARRRGRPGRGRGQPERVGGRPCGGPPVPLVRTPTPPDISRICAATGRLDRPRRQRPDRVSRSVRRACTGKAVSSMLERGAQRSARQPDHPRRDPRRPGPVGNAGRHAGALSALGVAEVALPADAAPQLAESTSDHRLKLPDCCVLLAAQQSEFPHPELRRPAARRRRHSGSSALTA